jgi:Protein of unknown function (DUF1203)
MQTPSAETGAIHRGNSMSTSFRVTGLSPAPFRNLFALSDDELERRHARRMIADAKPGYPDRVGLRDVEVGEAVILVNYQHLRDDGPYRSSHAIFVAERTQEPFDAIDRIPDVLRVRMLSLRAFDTDGLMLDADLVDGRYVEMLIKRLFADPAVAFIHVHYAKRGCYACRVDRVTARADDRFAF